MIALVIALSIFLIYFTSSIGLNSFLNYDYNNIYYFTGGISLIYSNFNILIISLVMALAFIVVIVITSTLILTKKRDIAIMKSLGSLPGKLYNYYLTEVYVVFFIGFLLGLLLGLASYGISALIFSLLGIPIYFFIDLFYSPILFFSCIGGIFIVPGFILRKIGNQKIVKTFSKDIPYSYDASKGLTFIPKWLSLIGLNFKTSVVNTLRRKGEFKRYLIVFSIISVIMFTLSIGIFVLNSSSQQWIRKSQGENIIAIGHREVVENYSLMYSMFSDPTLLIKSNDINFLESKYLFNFSDVEEIGNISAINKIDQRLISFFDVEELDGYHYYETSGYIIVGQQRTGTIPVFGINTSEIIQKFEIEGTYFNESDANINMVIGDGLAYNFFDYAFDQSMFLDGLNHTFRISGVVIDSLYSGYSGYIDIDIMREGLNYTNQEVNLILIEIEYNTYNMVQEELNTIIASTLGSNFTFSNLNPIFEQNLAYISNLTLYPTILIFIMAFISVLSLYNYQKGGIMEKSKDFLIQRAIGSKYKYIKRILFLEAIYVIIPSLSLSLGIGMILNAIFLFERVYLPPLYIPLTIFGIIFLSFICFNYISLFPIMKKVKKFNIKDFEIF
ncbi:MAG: FtsX-like permease family protein [Candidatus Hodarchaeota archaeon]